MPEDSQSNYITERVKIRGIVPGFDISTVSAVSVQSSINSMMQASITISPTGGSEVGRAKIFGRDSVGEFEIGDIIGEDVVIEYDTINGTKEIFRGYVTGGAWIKSPISTQYQLQCQSGPLAMMHTSVGSSGVLGWCYECDVAEEDALREALENGDFDSPKQFLQVAATALKDINDQQIGSTNLPESIQQFLPTVSRAIQDVLSDIEDMRQPDILERFWAYSGLLAEFPTEVALSMADKLTTNMKMPWLAFISQFLSGLGLYWVPTRWGTLLLPDMSFTNPPAFNTIMPSMLQSATVHTDTFTSPGYMLMGVNNHPLVDREEIEDALYLGQYLVYPEGDNPGEPIVPRFAANTYRIVAPPETAENFIAAAYDKDLAAKFEGKTLAQVTELEGADADRFADQIEKFKEFGQNWLAWHYYKDRYSNSVGNLETILHLPATPGFSAGVFDYVTNSVILGMVSSVSHNITVNSANTSWNLTSAVSGKRHIQAVQNSADNPFFVDLKNRIGEVAQQLTDSVSDVTEITNPEAYASYFKDPIRTANYTGRWT